MKQNLNELQLRNCDLINKALIEIGLTNKFLRAGILAVVEKESGFIPRHEVSYKNTPNSRIRQVFGLSRYNDAQITELKSDEEMFFNVIYDRKDLGNEAYGDGWKYRGRGFNQITGRANYQSVGNAIGVDLINKPELLDSPEVAAKALANFFRQSILVGQRLGLFLIRYGILTTSQISSIEKGATIAHQANMGWKKTPSQDPTGGYKETLKNAPSYLED